MAKDQTPKYGKRRLARLEEAERFAQSESCFASNVEEYEGAFQAGLMTIAVGDEKTVHPVVLEHVMDKRLKEMGVKGDPINEAIARQFYMLNSLSPKLAHAMMHNGASGFKTVGPVLFRLIRETQNLAQYLSDQKTARSEANHASPAGTPAEIDLEVEDAKFLEFARPLREAEEAEARRLRDAEREEALKRQYIEELAEWKAYSPEIQAEFIRYEKEEIAWTRDPNAPKPRRPDLGRDYEFFDFIRHFAPDHFSDEDREDSLQPPELEISYPPPPVDGDGCDLASHEEVATGLATALATAGSPPTPTLLAPELEPPTLSIVDESSRDWIERLESDRRRADEDARERRAFLENFKLEPIEPVSETAVPQPAEHPDGETNDHARNPRQVASRSA